MGLPSARKKKSGSFPAKTTVIIASEINAPANEKPIEWVLLTSVKITTLEEAKEVIQWYFKILKSGCKIEKLQLTNTKRHSACLALWKGLRSMYECIKAREILEKIYGHTNG